MRRGAGFRRPAADEITSSNLSTISCHSRRDFSISLLMNAIGPSPGIPDEKIPFVQQGRKGFRGTTLITRY